MRRACTPPHAKASPRPSPPAADGIGVPPRMRLPPPAQALVKALLPNGQPPDEIRIWLDGTHLTGFDDKDESVLPPPPRRPVVSCPKSGLGCRHCRCCSHATPDHCALLPVAPCLSFKLKGTPTRSRRHAVVARGGQSLPFQHQPQGIRPQTLRELHVHG